MKSQAGASLSRMGILTRLASWLSLLAIFGNKLYAPFEKFDDIWYTEQVQAAYKNGIIFFVISHGNYG